MLKSIFERLPKLRTAQEFSSILPEMLDRLDAIDAEEDDLEKELGKASFDAPDKAEAISGKIASLIVERKKLKASLAEAERRQREAAAAEQSAELERSAAEARKIQRDLRAAYIDLDERFSAVAKVLSEIRKGEAELQSHNTLVVQHQRKELIVRSPWWHLTRVWEEKHQNRVANEHSLISNAAIQGYYPHMHPDGPALSRMKQVKL